MRFTDLIGSQADYIQRQSIKPKHYPCPQCDKKGKRKHVITRRIAHVAALHRRSWIVAQSTPGNIGGISRDRAIRVRVTPTYSLHPR